MAINLSLTNINIMHIYRVINVSLVSISMFVYATYVSAKAIGG